MSRKVNSDISSENQPFWLKFSLYSPIQDPINFRAHPILDLINFRISPTQNIISREKCFYQHKHLKMTALIEEIFLTVWITF